MVDVGCTGAAGDLWVTPGRRQGAGAPGNGSAKMSTLKALGVAMTLTILSLAMMPGGSVFIGNF
ncbi:MAG: hypothetical protein HYY38_06405 [Rhodospirillales bacterium]|nr:hypothetical protein [Rhodospirillales bacterium]